MTLEIHHGSVTGEDFGRKEEEFESPHRHNNFPRIPEQLSSAAASLPVLQKEDLLPPHILVPHAPNDEENTVIAPWLDESSAAPGKRSFGLPQKASFSSFSLPRQGSTASLLSRTRNSESHSIAESYTSSIQSEATLVSSSPESRKGKSSMSIFNIIKKSRSRSRLASDSDRLGLLSRSHSPPNRPSQTFTDTFMTSLSIPEPPPPPPPPLPKKDKLVRPRRKAQNRPPPLPPKDGVYKLDTDIDHMEGIIKLTALPNQNMESTSSPGSGIESQQSSALSFSDASIHHASSSPTGSFFINPFLPSIVAKGKAHLVHDQRKVSPKTIFPMDGEAPEGDDRDDQEMDPVWIAPESWAVHKRREGNLGPEEASSEESLAVVGAKLPASNLSVNGGGTNKPKMRRKTNKTLMPPVHDGKTYRVRIYRADNTYHVATISLLSTVAELTPLLDMKLTDENAESHRLYLKERGRERLLLPTEKPAEIVRRRLEHAGYDQADSLDFLGGEDMTFLMKFIYKTHLLGPTAEDLTFDEFEYVDLTGRAIPAIPIVLHQNASSIIYLNLSRNPMVEIPLDFLQACTTLRELRLCNMAMKKVPSSVRHTASLHRLDLSCNRIMDLDDAGLDRIPELTNLKLQNNRIEKLASYFPGMRSLKYLNISNNMFSHFPSVICEMPSLVDLDVSFNTITELPDKIGLLKKLERLVILGNQVSKLPDECAALVSLRVLDCRRNGISDLSPVPYPLTSLDISHAKLSSFSDLDLSQLSSLQHLKIDNNSFRSIPDSLGELSRLITLCCSNNQLDALPSSIGQLQRLETLEAHNNSLKELPETLWNCASLTLINVTSNLLETWHDPPSVSVTPSVGVNLEAVSPSRPSYQERKMSSAASITSSTTSPLPSLAHSLERLYVGENRLTDEALPPLTILKELRVLNLSFNEIKQVPPSFLKNLVKLEELYLSGNNLTSIPIEDLHRLQNLTVLFLNGNQLQTLPRELVKIKNLSVIDVGSNLLKYNINNWEFDWNWNFNKNLKYLNLSGNKRLEIKPEKSKSQSENEEGDRVLLAGFTELTQLRVLGMMDVTTTFLPNIPDEGDDRRVRTSLSVVNGMSYGIADNIGKNGHLQMLDLVQPEFRERKNEAVFAMFGRFQAVTNNNRLSRFLHDKFIPIFSSQLSSLDRSKDEHVPDALRRTFLRLNKTLHDELYSNTSSRKMSQASVSTAGTVGYDVSYIRSGASGIVLYFVDKLLYVANVGQALAVISRQGSAELISTEHVPFNRSETARIRAAEGWISPKGLIHDETDTSRSFGFYHDFPVVNSRPDICVRPLTELDEFVIIGNRGLWDYVGYQTAVDIARSERGDPMIASQKLRDFAISYGADGSTMIMVISVADLFHSPDLLDPNSYTSLKRRGGKKADIADRQISRLDGEVSAPVGHLALAFTDIRNSTHLWEANAGMPTAMRLHNQLLRRQLRLCGGYVVKTEGDAFMCSFPTTLSALRWCLAVQVELLNQPWPSEILECDDGREFYDTQGNLVARGLSVRMGIHCGMPVCEPDPITNRMDYFGPMVNRSARITGSAAGGQIMCSADVVREINAKIFESGPDTEYSDVQPPQAIDAIRSMKIVVVPVGEVKLKGLEVPEMLSLVYPLELIGRQSPEKYTPHPMAMMQPILPPQPLGPPQPMVTSSKVHPKISHVRDLAILCLRLEALASCRVFRPREQNERLGEERLDSSVMQGDLRLLLPPLDEKTSDLEILMHLDSLSIRIENAIASLTLKRLACHSDSIVSALGRGGLDERTLQLLLSSLSC
ncbi:hypothetical protein SERLA73DRAFT_160301 [Serpula lacrymans var. lacrymans S7.3]|uniref:Adenylate cyclase n=1 Tax=Serpula lacrymans var. lacrymans (strain S7.3) TaxID=936435 RepID=F8PUC2_SERL3|nr:hypothetical protein SERLA73DRAFT_160301 [Serpula lacrymans var. lacrymans S7.3]